MPHFNLYIPKELDREIRKQAKLERKTLSAFLTLLIQKVLGKPEQKKEKFLSTVVGSWEGDFPSIERDLPEEI